MIRKKIDDILMGQNLMFMAFGVPNSGKSYSIFGNKLLCDPYFLEFIESIPERGKIKQESQKKKQIMSENLGVMGFLVWQMLDRIKNSEKVRIIR
jgi:hypothetical protein